MNIEQANHLDFPALMEHLGFACTKVIGSNRWYHSPLRQEKTASFQLSPGHHYPWVWHDHGMGEGGTVLSFICQWQQLGKKEALAFLRRHYPDYGRATQNQSQKDQLIFSFRPQSEPQASNFSNEAPHSSLSLIRVLPLNSQQIFSYLASRGITKEVARNHLQLIQYSHKQKGKKYFAFGMKNLAGGFELRSASDQYIFKSALPKRDISIIKAAENNNNNYLYVFEGMVDFLSYLILNNISQPPGDCLILHGVSQTERAKKWLQQHSYEVMKTYLDNDESGRNATTNLSEGFSGQHINRSPSFAPFKDVNDMLCHQIKSVKIR